VIVRYGDFVVTWRKKVCAGEVMEIKCYGSRVVVGSADGAIYFWNYSSQVLLTVPAPAFSKLNLGYSVTGFFFDSEGSEGVVATTESVNFVSLPEQMSSLLVGGSPGSLLFARVIQQQYLLTSHENGRLKLWNLETAE
jgi:WD40 repeat protein